MMPYAPRFFLVRTHSIVSFRTRLRSQSDSRQGCRPGHEAIRDTTTHLALR
jgi:hypothetical protein